MDILDHLICKNSLGEIQGFRVHNVTALSNGGQPTALGLLQYITSANSLNLHVGAASATGWKRLVMEGDSMGTAKLTLPNNKIWVGNGSSLPVETFKNQVPLSDWATPTANVSMGGYRLISVPDPMSGPSGETDAANRRYVDQRAQGFSPKGSCLLATTAELVGFELNTSDPFDNFLEASAIGTLTSVMLDSGAVGLPLVGGVDIGSRILVKNQSVSALNGIYYVASLGSAGTKASLHRASDCDENSELVGAYTLVQSGTHAGQGWFQTSTVFDIAFSAVILAGSITWIQFNEVSEYIGGHGLIITEGNKFNFASGSGYATGDIFFGSLIGSGDAAVSKIEILPIGSSGKLIQSNGSVPGWSSWKMPNVSPASQAMLVGNGTDYVTLASVTNRVLVSNAGSVAWGTDLASAITVGGGYIYRSGGTDVALIDGGTGSSLTPVNGGLVWSNSTGLQITAAGASGYFVRTNSTSAPSFYDLFGSPNTWTALNTFNAVANTSLVGMHTNGATYNALEMTTSGRALFGIGSAAPLISLYATDVYQFAAAVQGFNLIPLGGVAPVLGIFTAGGTGSTSLKSGTLGVAKTWTLPQSGTGVWQADAAGVITCAALPAASVTGVAFTPTSTISSFTLSTTGTPASSMVNAAGFTIGWAAGGAGKIDVDRGGTGVQTLTSNGLLTGNGTGPINALGAGPIYTVLVGTGAAPVFSASPTLTSLTTTGLAAISVGPFSTSTGEIRFFEVAANGGNYVGLKAPATLTANTVWSLPSADGAGFMKSNGSGALSLAAIAGTDVGGAALTLSGDTNITLTAGGSNTTALLRAASITLAWAGTLATARGGLGQAPTISQGGLLFASTGSAFQCSGAGVTGRILQSGGTGSPTWTGYAMPTTLGGANKLFVSSAADTVIAINSSPSRILTTDTSGGILWGGVLGVARDTSGGIARKYSKKIAGDNANQFINVVHNLDTTDVVAGIRTSNLSDAMPQQQSFTRIDIIDLNTVRVYFNSIQLTSDYYVVTVIG